MTSHSPHAVEVSAPAIPEDHERQTPGSRGQKRARLSRSKTSCLKCRNRKAKCGALPPDSCPYCLKHNLECVWPNEDRRTLRFMQDDLRAAIQQAQAGPRQPQSVEDPLVTPDCQGSARLDQLGNVDKGQDADMSGQRSVWERATCIAPDQDPLARFEDQSSQPSRPLRNTSTLAPLPGEDGAAPAMTDPTPQIEPVWTSWLVPSAAPSPRTLVANPDYGGDSISYNLNTLGNTTLTDLFPGTDFSLQLLLDTNGSSRGTDGNPLWPFDAPAGYWSHGQSSMAGSSEPEAQTRQEVPAALGTGRSGVMRIKYLRAHGRTAFVPGTLAIPIKIQLSHSPSAQLGVESPLAASSPNNSVIHTSPDVLRHLLTIFETYLQPLYPCVDCRELERSIEEDAQPGFLLNCVAAISARFSSDPRVARGLTKPEEYGDIYYERANAMLGSVMRLPLRETVIGFLLLASCADSVTGQWMMAGIAVRMAIDLGLHRKDPESTDADTSRQNRLCFWCVLSVDYMVSLGVGRLTSLCPESITQPLPTDADMSTSPVFTSTDSTTSSSNAVSNTDIRSPFPFAVHMMHSYGPLINILNSEEAITGPVEQAALADKVRLERVRIMREYQNLPSQMQWSLENLRRHNSTGQGAMFFHLHIWLHTVLSNSIISSSTDQSQECLQGNTQANNGAGLSSPIDQLSRSGAKLVAEYLSFCTIVNPAIYYTHPFLGQPLFTAGRVIMDDLQRHLQRSFESRGSTIPSSEMDVTSSLLTNIARSQVDVIKQALSESGVYWRGATLVKDALEQSINAICEQSGQAQAVGPKIDEEGAEGGDGSSGVQGKTDRNVWRENKTYAVEVYDWSLPGRYRADGAQVN